MVAAGVEQSSSLRTFARVHWGALDFCLWQHAWSVVFSQVTTQPLRAALPPPPLRWIISKQRNQWHWCHREIVVKLALSTTTNFHRVLCEGYCHLNLQVWSRLQSPDDTINTILPNKGKFLFQNSRKSAPHYPQTRRKMKACRNDCSDLTNCVNKWFFSPSDFKCCEVKLNCCKSFNRNLKMMSALPPRSGESPSRRGGGVSRLAMMQVRLFLPSSAQA